MLPVSLDAEGIRLYLEAVITRSFSLIRRNTYVIVSVKPSSGVNHIFPLLYLETVENFGGTFFGFFR